MHGLVGEFNITDQIWAKNIPEFDHDHIISFQLTRLSLHFYNTLRLH